jgi:hypothetical protein
LDLSRSEVTNTRGLTSLPTPEQPPGWQSYFVMVPGTRDAVVVFLNGLPAGLTRLGEPIGQNALDILYDLKDIPPADYSRLPADAE